MSLVGYGDDTEILDGVLEAAATDLANQFKMTWSYLEKLCMKNMADLMKRENWSWKRGEATN